MRPPALAVLDRYLIRELAPPFGLGLALLTFFLIIDRLYQLTDLVITKGVPFPLVLELLLFMLPSFFALALPMALLIGVLLAGGRLAGDLEVIAFKAAGVSLIRLLRPVLLFALAVALVTAGLTLVVGPIANGEFQRQLFRILQSRASSGLQERVFNTTFGDVTIYVEDVSPSQIALRGVLVSDERDPKLSRIITAREGRLLADEGNRRLTLRLLQGAVNEADVARAEAAVNGAPPPGAVTAGRYRYTLFSVYDMNLSVDAWLQGAAKLEKPEKDLSLGELSARIDTAPQETATVVPFRVEWHKRFALPVAALVFALVGFPLAVRSHRGGRSIALVGSLTILLSYYLVGTSLENAALRERLPAWLAVWLPNGLFAATGLVMLTSAAREWRAPRLAPLWRALEAVRRRLPRGRSTRAPAAGGAPARHSTHIIDRYLIREFLAFLALGLAVVASLYVVVDLVQTLDKFLRIKPPLVYILEHFVYRVPGALHDGLPVVMLVATIFLYLTLTRYHELTALKAAGVSLYRVSAPVLLLGLVIAGLSGAFQELVLPRLNERGEEVDRVKIRGQLPRHLQSRQRLWLRSADTRFYRVDLLSPTTSDLYGVTVLEIDRDFRVVNRLDARQVHWAEGGWELSDGAIREISADGRVQTVPFRRTALDLKERIDDFTGISKPVSVMSYRELREYVSRLEAAGFQVKKYLVELYSKLSFPLVNLIMVLVAIPFALHAPRGGRLIGIGLAIIILAAYLVVHYVALAFARADLLPPLLAAWTANVIFMGLGVSLFLRART
jgi:LPS export ABC transporter permease LptG/LPS export ABC transporter permease LptF